MNRQVAISGMGRIGRLLLRKSMGISNLQVVAVNAVYPIETIVHLLKYDTIHGKWDADISVSPHGQLVINGNVIKFLQERDAKCLPWTELGVDIVLEATGKYTHRQDAVKHIHSGARKVIVTAPGSGLDVTVVMGVNEKRYAPDRHVLLSAASCTTNCVAPVLKILDDAFRIQSGWMTTVHAYTNDQKHLDNPHKDLRRARSCTQSIIPTSSGVQQAIADVIPHLAPTLHGISLRVPTQDVSLVDLTVQLHRGTSYEEVRQAFELAINGAFAPYVEWSEEPLVSADYIGNEKSAIVDGLSMVVSDDQLKMLVWYDNEWAYACRVIDLARYMIFQENTCVV